MRTVIDDLELRIEALLASGSFEAASPLLEEYGSYATAALKRAATPLEREVAFARSSAFLRDRLYLVRAMRSHLATQFLRNNCASSYVSSVAHQADAEKPTWRIEA